MTERTNGGSFNAALDLVLLQATNEMNVSIPEVADLLIERVQSSSWVVSFKALITIHHLMCYGNEVASFELVRCVSIREFLAIRSVHGFAQSSLSIGYFRRSNGDARHGHDRLHSSVRELLERETRRLQNHGFRFL